MPSYFYSSTAGIYTLTGAVNSSATVLVLNNVTGLPASTPYKVVLDPGQPGEEIVKVTSVAGSSLTVVRGWDGTAATAHGAGVPVRHMVTAEDFTLSRSHEDATAAHGATGAVMGTTNAQTVTNKNLTDPTNTFPSNLATLTGTQALANKDLSSATNSFPPSLATLTGTQALSNKDLTAATNTFPASLVTLTDTQTLTKKTLTAPVINGATGTGGAFTGPITATNLPQTSGPVAGKRMHWATVTGTVTGGNGVISFGHALGWTPNTILVTSNTIGSVVCTTATATSTQFSFTFYFASTGAKLPDGAGNITFSFLALE